MTEGLSDQGKRDLQQSVVLCHNEAQQEHVNFILDNEYLDLMRNPGSSIFMGDELSESIDKAFGPRKQPKEENPETISDGGGSSSGSDSDN